MIGFGLLAFSLVLAHRVHATVGTDDVDEVGQGTMRALVLPILVPLSTAAVVAARAEAAAAAAMDRADRDRSFCSPARCCCSDG